MASLYVAYSAQRCADKAFMTGLAILSPWKEPENTDDIRSLCDKIAASEYCEHVVPLWWKEIPGLL